MDSNVELYTTDEYVYGRAYIPGGFEGEEGRSPASKQVKKSLYDRIEQQWLILMEVGFTLTTLSSSALVAGLLRSFGAILWVWVLAAIALASIAILLRVFWAEIGNNEFRLKGCFLLFSISASIAVMTGDIAIDFILHYWRILAGLSIASGTILLIVMGLIIVQRFNK